MTILGDVLIGCGQIGIGAGQAAIEQDAFGGSTLLVAGVLALLAGQEAERAAAWRCADIAAMRALLGDAAPATGGGMTLSDLDAAWATLADALILAHAAAEQDGDGARDAAFCAFYRDSAARRALEWPI